MDTWTERLILLLTADEQTGLARLLCLCTGATFGLLWGALIG